jgi:hypothetical protein
MKIQIETIPHKKQRYETLGDWQWSNAGDLQIKISQTNNEQYNFLLIVHELIEAYLCKFHKISEDTVDQWDMSHLQSRDPAQEVGCPYAKEHFTALRHERLLAGTLNLDWQIYEDKLDQVS